MIVIIIIMVVVGESRGRKIGCGGDVPYNYDRTNKAKITNFLMLYMIQGVLKNKIVHNIIRLRNLKLFVDRWIT